MNPIRLFIVDETFRDPSSAYWSVARAQLKASASMSVIGSASSPQEALGRIDEITPDIAVVCWTSA
ncbi:MAG: hypothetical protein O3C10_09530 [Chloroflexi bacterium]|nr:hypothetical protein [Chloroflexota bacterium]